MYGIHGPNEYDRNTTIIENTREIGLLHFDCVGFESWTTKWGRRLDGSSKSLSLRPNRVNQLQAFTQANQKGNKALRNLYKRFHVIPVREKGILFLLGMLTRVKLDPSLFENPRGVKNNTVIQHAN